MPRSEPSFSLPGSNRIPSEVAARHQAGAICPYCPTPIKVGSLIRVCPDCQTIHHGRCWEKIGRCGAFDCSSPRREPVSTTGSVLVISSEELARATPLPPRPSSPIPRPIYRPGPSGPVINRLAIIALMTAIAGIPFFGLLTGFVAIGMAVVALLRISERHEQGKGLAIGALTLGAVDVVGWFFFLAWSLSGTSPDQIFRDRGRPALPPPPPPPPARGAFLPGRVSGFVSMTIASEGLQSS
jgi:Domain of unknown function (DUF4190)/Prokaryotic RING finger family 1